jgi:hypothetical protein
MVTRINSRAHQRSNEEEYDFVVPWEIVDSHPAEGIAADTEQHKKRYDLSRNQYPSPTHPHPFKHPNQHLILSHSYGQVLRKRSIRHYSHATTRLTSALESFSPLWFAIAISTGGLASILSGPFPYPAPWQGVLASILYVFEIVLFTLFLILQIARWVLYPHVAVRRALSDADELGAYAIMPIALMTIAGLTASQVSRAGWGGHAFTLVAYVLWWIGLVWIFVTALVVITVLIYTGNQMDRVMTPVLFMAPVGLATAGTEAGLISIFSEGMSARLAAPMLVVLLYGMYFHRLLSAGWSKPGQRAAIFILVSPLRPFPFTSPLPLLPSFENGDSGANRRNVHLDRSNRPTLNRSPTPRHLSIRLHALRRVQTFLRKPTHVRHFLATIYRTSPRRRWHPPITIAPRLRLPLFLPGHHRRCRRVHPASGLLLLSLVECGVSDSYDDDGVVGAGE